MKWQRRMRADLQTHVVWESDRPWMVLPWVVEDLFMPKRKSSVVTIDALCGYDLFIEIFYEWVRCQDLYVSLKK